MNIEDVKTLTPLNRLIYWIEERESIRLRKERGDPRPWTDDMILDRYRFCNVRRMDDRVSKWLLDEWYRPNYDHKNMLGAVVLARHFNLPRTLEVIGFPLDWQPDEVKQRLTALRETNTLFNGAYVIASDGTPDKMLMVIDRVTRDFVGKRVDARMTSTMRGGVETLSKFDGFGSFMAGQVVADLRWAVSGTWSDRETWAPKGPGSQRGMNRLRGDDPHGRIDDHSFSQELKRMVGECRSRLPRSISERMEAMDYQNCLCEFDKYERALWREGKPKQRYTERKDG